MKEIGDILRRKRTEKNFSQEFINSQTHIPLKYVSALEEGDLSVFPAEVYYLGSLRKYAKYLGLNDEDLVVIYRRQVLDSQLVNAGNEKQAGLKLSKSFYGVLAAAVLLFFGSLFVWIEFKGYHSSFKNKIDSLICETKTFKTAAIPEIVKKEYTEMPAPAQSLTKELGLSAECVENAWVKVSTDGKSVFEGTMRKGDKKEWIANEKFYLSIGYVPGIKVWLNGKEIDVKKGSKWDINNITLTREDLVLDGNSAPN